METTGLSIASNYNPLHKLNHYHALQLINLITLYDSFRDLPNYDLVDVL